MKTKLKRPLVILLSLLMMISLFPATVLAADNENVLSTMYLTAADQTLNVASTKTGIFTVDYSFSGTEIDLETSGFDYTLKTGYTLVSAEFLSGHIVEIDGISVPLTISYKQLPSDTTYTSVYNISVVRGAPENATFTGTITKPVTLNATLSFSVSDFTDKYTKNDQEDIGGISITGINPAFGSLKYDGSDYVMGTRIAITDIADLTFASNPTLQQSNTVTYTIRAYAGAATTNPIGSVSLIIQLITVPTISSSISKTVNKNATMSFTASDFTSAVNLHYGSLVEIEITPTNTGFGTWKIENTAFTSGSQVLNAESIATLNFTGTKMGTATFNWRIKNEAGYSTSGTGTVVVGANITLTAFTAPRTISKGAVWIAAASHFVYTPITDPIKYVKIISVPSSSIGYLYLTNDLASSATYGYPAIRNNTALSAGAVIPVEYLQYLRIYTRSSTDASSVAFTWSATTDSVISDADWANTVSYTVTFTPAISYKTTKNTPVTFNAETFNTVCYNATGYNLSYVKFTLPSYVNGMLFYNYNTTTKTGTAVSASTSYMRSGTPGISGITFVPTENYTSTFSLTYTAYNINGDTFTGTITISVKDVTAITYTAYKNTPLKFSADNFNTVCSDLTGYDLSYIKFTLPSSTYGKLYYNYTTPGSYESLVSASTNYYRIAYPGLSNVSFVPTAGYTGAVTITYTAYNTNGQSYTGTIAITVKNVTDVTYQTYKDTVVKLSSDSFNAACSSATGYNLSYVKFTLPSASAGTLYYNYVSSSNPGTPVSAATNYNRLTSPTIAGITFVPYAGFIGNVTINYTGTNTNGVFYNGTLIITVSPLQSRYFTDVGTNFSWAVPAIDYLYEEGIVAGITATTFGPTESIRRGDFILMLDRAYDFPSTTMQNFADVPKGSYYYNAIASAKAYGIATGDGTNFYPTEGLTRQDAMVLILRTLKAEGINLPVGTISDLSGFTDKGEVANYALTAVATLVKAGIIEGDGSKINPTTILTRAEMAAILYRVLTM